ncbi:MAG: acyl-CoA dehydrogenase family protein [bacterium]|nr:acyl-CoA dehydrogenase family protein [bacterium]
MPIPDLYRIDALFNAKQLRHRDQVRQFVDENIIPRAISLVKRANVRMALNVARNSRDLLGAVGILDDFSTMRHMNNLESVFTYEGTDHIHTLVVGEKLTGLAAWG